MVWVKQRCLGVFMGRSQLSQFFDICSHFVVFSATFRCAKVAAEHFLSTRVGLLYELHCYRALACWVVCVCVCGLQPLFIVAGATGILDTAGEPTAGSSAWGATRSSPGPCIPRFGGFGM